MDVMPHVTQDVTVSWHNPNLLMASTTGRQQTRYFPEYFGFKISRVQMAMPIDLIHKSPNTPVPYVHISVPNGAFWDME